MSMIGCSNKHCFCTGRCKQEDFSSNNYLVVSSESKEIFILIESVIPVKQAEVPKVEKDDR
jgi:hypothetical protein